MKFSRPINREVDIDGNTFIVTVEETGVGFRLKGKRKTARVEWNRVLEIAQGEGGERASEFLGVAEGSPRKADQAGSTDRGEHGFEPQASEGDEQSDQGFSRTATARE